MASALVATVHGSYDFSDQLPEGGRFVMVFPTKQEAIEAAVAMLVDVGQVSRYHHGGWLYEGQHYTSPDELLSDWQDSLGSLQANTSTFCLSRDCSRRRRSDRHHGARTPKL